MNREILFHGKRLDNGEWVEGLVYQISDDTAPFIMLKNKHAESHRVDPSTVGQYTGRIDKNGVKVFEHAILQMYVIWADGRIDKSEICFVEWCENDQCYVLTTKDGLRYDDFGNYGNPDYYEVIGNIHDNPELLEG